MGHGWLLHARVSVPLPEHGLPFHFGAGLVHVRARVWEPPPHTLVQVVQPVKLLHPPWRGLWPLSVQSPPREWCEPSLWVSALQLP